jgi:hypothetical protein
MFQKVQRTLGWQARFFWFLSWKESLRAPEDRFFLTYSSSLSVLLWLSTNLWVYDRFYCSKSSDLINQLVN